MIPMFLLMSLFQACSFLKSSDGSETPEANKPSKNGVPLLTESQWQSQFHVSDQEMELRHKLRSETNDIRRDKQEREDIQKSLDEMDSHILSDESQMERDAEALYRLENVRRRGNTQEERAQEYIISSNDAEPF